MKLFELKSFYIITDIKEHRKNKSQLLRWIDEMPENRRDPPGFDERISKTDWNLPSSYKRNYSDVFHGMMRPYLNDMAFRLRCKCWKIHNTWYQVYEKGDTHGWHTHGDANYTNVYYLSLPNKSIKTQLYDVVNHKIVENIEVKEGQLLTFPASVIHRSPINKVHQEKVIISFNTDFTQPTIKTKDM